MESPYLRYCKILAAFLAGLAVTQPGVATTKTANLAVSAQISPTCSITTTPVDFGVIDPTSGAFIPGTGSISVTCTNGTPWSAAAGQGVNPLTQGTGWIWSMEGQSAAPAYLKYSLFMDAAHTNLWTSGVGNEITGTGTGLLQNKTVYALINNNQNSIPVDSYNDLVTITLTY